MGESRPRQPWVSRRDVNRPRSAANAATAPAGHRKHAEWVDVGMKPEVAAGERSQDPRLHAQGAEPLSYQGGPLPGEPGTLGDPPGRQVREGRGHFSPPPRALAA